MNVLEESCKNMVRRTTYYGDDYLKYLQTPHWRELNRKLIYSNRSAKCWICGKLNSLVIHHIRYDNLFHERQYRDVYLLCHKCHSRVHFWYLLGIMKIKTPLRRRHLLHRMVSLKCTNMIRKRRFGLALWYVLRYTLWI